MTDEVVTDQDRRAFYNHMFSVFEALSRLAPGRFPGGLVGLAHELSRIDGRPTDVSSIANMLGIPRATLWRRVRDLETSGLLQFRSEGRRSALLDAPDTQLFWDDFRAQVDKLIRDGRVALHPPTGDAVAMGEGDRVRPQPLPGRSDADRGSRVPRYGAVPA